MHPVGGHAVGGDHRPQGDGVFVASFVAHDAHRLHRQEYGTRLPDAVVQVVSHLVGIGGAGQFARPVPESLDENVVCIAQDPEFLLRHLAQDSDPEARAGERMTADQLPFDAEGTTHPSHFVLEQGTQRFHDLQVHLLGKATHVVMRLDLAARAVDADALDHVGIDGALGQPTGPLDLLRLGVEDLDEGGTDGLAFGLGIGDTLQLLQEQRPGMDADHVQPHLLIGVEHLPKLILAQQAVIHEDTGQVVANRLVEQHGSHGAVHAARQAQDDLVVAQLLAKRRHGILHKGGRCPVALASTDAQGEVLEKLRPFLGMEHLGMELHGVGLLAVDGIGGVLHIFGGGDHPSPFRQTGDGVAMAHPHLAGRAHPLEQRRSPIHHLQHGTSVLAGDGAVDFPTKMMGHELGTVANPKQRQFALDPLQVHVRSLFITHREGASAEDNALHMLADGGDLVIGMDFAIDVQLAQTTADQLGHLGAKIEDENHFLHGTSFLQK